MNPNPVPSNSQSLPSGTVTFLFTDIEGSTKLWQQFPNAMPNALARHHEILQRALEAHNGYVFQIIGDAFCAAFATAFDGLDAALHAQRALRDFAWGETGAIRVRMALHTGAAEVRAGEFTSGEFVSGYTLSRAARLLGAGHGGQILLSEPTAALVREQLPPNTAFRDMGAHRLKDLVQPQQIFQILASDLPQEFPPLKTLDALPNNLPIQLTSFVGREKEIQEVRELLHRARLLTLTGAGGSGKTRLSLQVAADLIDEFEKGTWFVELAPIADASLVPNAVMSALELREEAGRAPLDALTDFLRAKNLLLILDNCEHLIEACARLAHHLLTHCPDLKILASSREGLGVAGEVTYQVPSLALPDPKHLPSLETLSQFDAVKLFIERATAVQPNFQVTNANAPAVAQICFRLDGIPLALELAAARIKLFSPEQIAARLDDRLRLLTGGSRTVMPRQQTLRAAIEWSYSLLSEPERVLFRRLAVFAGGWTFEAAEQVCAGDGIDAFDVLELLAQLVNKSLVMTEARGDETRYRMLETIREYAFEKLREHGEVEALRTEHLEYFVGFAELAHSRKTIGEVMNSFESELDNLRAAFQWSVKNKDGTFHVTRLANLLAPFWLFRGYVSEGRERITEALASLKMQAPTVDHARALFHAAYLAYRQTDYGVTRLFASQSLEIFKALGDRAGIADALEPLANVATENGNYQLARDLITERLRLRRELNDLNGVALALIHLAWVEIRPGNYELAKKYFEEGLSVYRQVANQYGIALTLSGLGEIATRKGDYAHARDILEESLSVRRAQDDKWGIGVSFGSLAWIEMRQENWERATLYLRDSLSTRAEIGDRGGIAWCLEHFAAIAYCNNRHLRAIQLSGSAEALREEIQSVMDPVDRPEYEKTLATLRAQVGEYNFEKAWTEGRALTLEQAIELALSEETASG